MEKRSRGIASEKEETDLIYEGIATLPSAVASGIVAAEKKLT